MPILNMAEIVRFDSKWVFSEALAPGVPRGGRICRVCRRASDRKRRAA